jgi:hypothetical protein
MVLAVRVPLALESKIVAKHRADVAPSSPVARVKRVSERHPSRDRFALFLFSFAVSIAVLAVNAVDPYSGATASPYFQMADRYDGAGTQTLEPTGAYETAFTRDGYEFVAAPVPEPEDDVSADEGGTLPEVQADPGSAQDIAHGMVLARGWGEDQFSCLVALWNKESGWRVNAENTSSGAYGIPQALPGKKMGSAGSDWATNPATQITWGLGYISGRYGTPCGAWGHFQAKGSY